MLLAADNEIEKMDGSCCSRRIARTTATQLLAMKRSELSFTFFQLTQHIMQQVRPRRRRHIVININEIDTHVENICLDCSHLESHVHMML